MSFELLRNPIRAGTLPPHPRTFFGQMKEGSWR